MTHYSLVEQPRLINAEDIATFFGKPASWFKRDRVRKALYARGFPLPIIRGRWLRSAVDAWLEREGKQSGHAGLVQTKQTSRRHASIA